jgi:hypothetical protein
MLSVKGPAGSAIEQDACSCLTNGCVHAPGVVLLVGAVQPSLFDAHPVDLSALRDRSRARLARNAARRESCS